MCYVWRKKGEACNAKNTFPNGEHVGGIIRCGCIDAGETGALQKIDLKHEAGHLSIDILKQHLKTSARKLKLGRK